MITLHVNIDYTEGDPNPYRGVIVTRTDNTTVMRWASGDPHEDWMQYVNWSSETGGLRFLEGSSITNFLFDVPGWTTTLDENGREIIVRKATREKLQERIEK